jgi:hypothetical protein
MASPMNLSQVFAANPRTTIGASDLFYMAEAGTTDAGIDGASLLGLFTSSALAAGKFYVGNALGVATAVTMSGDGTLSDTGVLTIASSSPWTASGTDSAVGGDGTSVASGDYSLSYGSSTNTVSGNDSYAFGTASNITGNNLFVAGGGHTLSGHHSAAFGNTHAGEGANSFVWGRGNTVSGDYAFAGGYGAVVNNDGSVVWGDSNQTPNTDTTANQFNLTFAGGYNLYCGSTLALAINSSGVVTTPSFSPTVTAVTTTATLPSSAYGKIVSCTGSSSYIVTLPAQSAGKIIQFAVDTTSNALVEVLPASGTINGQSSLSYGSGEGCTIYSDGTNCFTIADTLQPVFSNCNNSSNISVTNSSLTKIGFNNTNIDQGGFWNTSQNKYEPLYPGNYLFNVFCYFTGTFSVTDFVQIELFLNGSQVQIVQSMAIPSSGSMFFTASFYQVMNGKTDSVQFYINGVCTGTNLSYRANASYSYCTTQRVSRF